VLVDREKCFGCEACSEACPGKALRLSGNRMTVSQVLVEVARDRVFYEHSGGGMTLSGGEPLAQPDFALALLRAARELGLHTAVETTGLAGAGTVERVLRETDLILYDIKQIDPSRHREGTGVNNSAILANAKLAAGLGVAMILRVPVIPEFNDQPDTIQAIARFGIELGLSELHLLPYHTYGPDVHVSWPSYFVYGADGETPDRSANSGYKCVCGWVQRTLRWIRVPCLTAR
jgi:pyruvate formate lyase activating enzyme